MAESEASDNRVASALVARLRMLFAESVGQPSDAIRQDLIAEVAHAVAEAPADARAALVRDLLGGMPGWESALAVNTAPASPSERP